MCTGSTLWRPLRWGGSGWRRFSGNCSAARSCPGMSRAYRRRCSMAETYSENAVAAQRGHETRDFNIRAVALFALGLAIILAGSLALMAWVFGLLRVTPAAYSLQGAPIAALPPQPP